MVIEADKGVPNQRLKREREKRGWSQRDLATLIDTNLYTVSRWERGLTVPHSSTLDKLCKLFEKSPWELGFTKEGGTGGDQSASSLPSQNQAPRDSSQRAYRACQAWRNEEQDRKSTRL